MLAEKGYKMQTLAVQSRHRKGQGSWCDLIRGYQSIGALERMGL